MSRKLLFSVTKKDLEVTYFSGKGAGGQHRNRHRNCVRIKHPESGALVTGQSHKERKSNMREALHNLVEDIAFKKWHHLKVQEILIGESIEETVDKAMSPDNLTVEVKDEEGHWAIEGRRDDG